MSNDRFWSVPSALAYAVRTHLPLVQVPSGGRWGYSGAAPFTTAESWLGRPLSGSVHPRELILRYLAAFGPATVEDLQKWSGLNRLKDFVEEMKPLPRSYRDERGNARDRTLIMLSKEDRDTLTEEGERLVSFVEDEAKNHKVRFAEQTSS